MGLYRWAGKILRRLGAIAASAVCCCGEGRACACYPLTPWVDIDGALITCALQGGGPDCVCEPGFGLELDCGEINGVFRPVFYSIDTAPSGGYYQITCTYRYPIMQWGCLFDQTLFASNTVETLWLILDVQHYTNSPEDISIAVTLKWEAEDANGPIEINNLGQIYRKRTNGYVGACGTENYLTEIDLEWSPFVCIPQDEDLTIVVGFD